MNEPDSRPETMTVYVQDYVIGGQSKLYRLDPATGKTQLVGPIASEVFDLALVDGELYALEKPGFSLFRRTMKLLKVDRQTGKPSLVGDTGFDVVGMDYNPVRQVLYATAHEAGQLVSLNLKTGRGTVAVTLSDRDRNCGEIAFDASGNAFITLIGTDLIKYLATCDLDTGKVSIIGDTGFPGLASMDFIGETLYGVAGYYSGVGGRDGQIIRLDTATGQGTLVAMTEPTGRWAGMAVHAPVAQIGSPPLAAQPGEPHREANPPESRSASVPTAAPAASEASTDPAPAGAQEIATNPVTPAVSGGQPEVPAPVAPGVSSRGDGPAESEISQPPAQTSAATTVAGKSQTGRWTDDFFSNLSFDQFERNPATDIVCVAPVRTIIRREEEITIIRRVRKVEEVESGPTCPTSTTQIQ